MELREKAKISLLFDFYAPMLTSRQAEIMQFYYSDDLSLAGNCRKHWAFQTRGKRRAQKKRKNSVGLRGKAWPL